MNIDLWTIQPSARGTRIKTAAELQAAVAGRFPVGLEFQFNLKIPILVVRQEPNVVMILALHGITENCSAINRPESFLAILWLTLNGPARKVYAVK